MISKKWYWLGLVGSSLLLVIAYFYFQQTLDLVPCSLCMFQRASLVFVAAFCLFGLLGNFGRGTSIFLSAMISIASGIGLTFAGRQVWLQHLPADQVPACGPDLSYMLSNFPLFDVIETVFSGSGECAEVSWRWLGLSMGEWMVLVFSAMLIFAITLLIKVYRKRSVPSI